MTPSDHDLLIRIDAGLAEMKRVQSEMKNTQQETLTQYKLTNGRVTQLEMWRSRLMGVWYAVLIGSTAIGFIVGVIITVTIK